MEKGSVNTAVASSKLIPRFLRFALAFSSSYSKISPIRVPLNHGNSHGTTVFSYGRVYTKSGKLQTIVRANGPCGCVLLPQEEDIWRMTGCRQMQERTDSLARQCPAFNAVWRFCRQPPKAKNASQPGPDSRQGPRKAPSHKSGSLEILVRDATGRAFVA
jgi:hypothetical protein